MAVGIEGIFDAATNSISYLVYCDQSKAAAIIDPVLNFDLKSGHTSTDAADLLLASVAEKKLDVQWLLETHVHADHLTAAPYLAEQLIQEGARPKRGIGRGIVEVQKHFKNLFQLDDSFSSDGRQFDTLFQDNDCITVGELDIEIWEAPGHTPACVMYKAGAHIFVGDTLFMPDFGTARCDFPGGSAPKLFRSIKRVLALPGETTLYMCHDYAPGGRDYAWITTVSEQRAKNIHIHDGIDEAAFVETRETRDRQLSVPELLLPAIQVNMNAGTPPASDADGLPYLKIPLNRF